MNWNSLPAPPFLEHFRISKDQFKRLGYAERLERIRMARQTSPGPVFLEQLEGDTLFRLGQEWWRQKQTERAWEALEAATVIFRKSGWEDSNSLECLRMLYLANTFLKREKAAASICREFSELLAKTIHTLDAAADGDRRDLVQLARSLFYDAVGLSRRNDQPAALASLLRCREICEKLGWKNKIAQIYRQEIIIRNNSEDLDGAQKAYSTARRLYEEIGDTVEIARTDWLASRTYFLLGKRDRSQYERALELHYLALKPMEAAGYDTYWNRYQIGLNLLGLRREWEAVAEIDKAIVRLEERRSKFRALAIRRNLQEDTIKIYQTAVDMHFKLGNITRAYELSERSRSMTFLDLLENSAIFQNPRKEDGPTVRRRKELKKRFAKLEEELHEQDNAFAFGSVKAEELRKEIDNLNREYSSLPIRSDYEQYPYDELDAPVAATLEEIRRWLDDGQVIVEYALGKKRALAFVIERTGFEAVALDLPAAKADALAAKFLRELENLSGLSGRRLEAALSGTYALSRRELYRALIAPIKDRLAGKRHVVIVPDGSLFRVPFQLLGDNGRCLLDDHAVSYLPLLGVLKYRSKPKLSKDVMARAEALLIENPLGDLEHTSSEIEQIRGILPPGRSTVWLRGEAKANRFLAEAGNYQLVHFAGHSVFRNDRPFMSHLRFVDDNGKDTPVDVDDIIEKLRLRQNLLLVLSSCSSGKVEVGKSREVLGLIRGLIFAGAPSLVLTLWNIADSPVTSELMADFYRRLLECADPSEALRRAQLSVRDKHPSPYLWGSFVYYGL